MVNPFPRHKTKIVCTIGTASRKKSVLKDLVRAGMNVARLNFSHGDLTQHAQDIQTIRQVSQELGRTVAILGDLPGPKIRIGVLKGGACTLNKGNRVVLTTRQVQGTADLILVVSRSSPEVKGERIFLNDGFIEPVLEIKGEDIIRRVVIEAACCQTRMNLPRDLFRCHRRRLGFIAFGIEQGIDMFGLSFVGGPADISRVREFARTKGSEIFVVAKMERREAVKNSREIIEAVDAVMVARGDLGVEIPIEEVPLVQKQLILQANLAAKPVITATQMLQSMTANTRPTRAEATDVANAIFDGTDAVMLSEETAIGIHPVTACRMLSRIATAAEAGRSRVVPGTTVPETIKRTIELSGRSIKETLSLNVIRSIVSLGIRCVAVPSRSGLTARMISRLKGDAWVVALCFNDAVLKALSLSSGVYPVPKGSLSSDEDIISYLRDHGFVRENEPFILVQREACPHLGVQSTMKIIARDSAG